MLTALAVVHWNERRLPEQRADLYDSIVHWLARSREQRPGRPSAERCLALLQELALYMQNHPEGRQVQLPSRWAAEALAAEFGERAGEGRAAPSRRAVTRSSAPSGFLDEEEIDSGIVVGRGNEVSFWHLTFQEYLAARAIAGRARARAGDGCSSIRRPGSTGRNGARWCSCSPASCTSRAGPRWTA